MERLIASMLAILLFGTPLVRAQKYTGSDERLRVALTKQPFSPNGTSSGPNTMANGGIQEVLERLGAVVRIDEAALSPNEATEGPRDPSPSLFASVMFVE